MLGFRYQEALHGGFYLLANPVLERAADLTLQIASDGAAFVQSRTATARGVVRLEGFADDPASEGKLVFDREQRRVLYELAFGGMDGARYRLRGHKQLEVLNLLDSFTLVRASIYDARATEVGRAVIRFDARGNWRSLLRSFGVSL